MPDTSTRDLLADAARRAADYLEGLETRGVAPDVQAIEKLIAGLDQPLPDAPESAAAVLAFIDDFGSAATAATAGGRYLGFVTGGALPAALATNILATAWDQNAFSFVSSPAAAKFEEAALRWVKEALGLPQAAGGALVTGATMANFTGLAAARNQVLKRANWDVDADGLFGAPELTVFVGAEAHAVVAKVLSMLGLGRGRVQVLPVDDQGRIIADDLPEISGPTIVCLQAGNVNSGAFDPADKLIPWAHDGGAWVHVDGAFGLWALASAELRYRAAGFEAADSWATDAHKWLNVPYDSGILIVRDEAALGRAMSIGGAYLQASEHRDALNYTPDSSRRARAIDVWAALKSLGRSGLAEMFERHCRQARRLAAVLQAEDGVRVLNDVVLNQVVVTFGDTDRTNRVIAGVQASGECWAGGTVWQDQTAMRLSVSSWATTDNDIERTIQAIVGVHRRL